MPYGILAADQITSSVTGSSIGPGNATRFKNRIINGDMRIDQRNAGAQITPTNGGYTVDRWIYQAYQAGKVTCQQNAGSITPPTGFTNYLGYTSTSAYTVGAGEAFWTSQRIEGYNVADLAWGTANAKTVTLSFLVRSSLTGTFGGAIGNLAGTQSYPFSYSIPVANTWTQISITIPGSTTGVWPTDNTSGMLCIFSLGAGSTFSTTAGAWASGQYLSSTGATSVVGTNGATWYITGVQLEVGSSATGFEYVDYTMQLAMCQRYYYRMYQYAATATYQRFGIGFVGAGSSTDLYATVFPPVTMRAAPTTVEFSNVGAWNGGALSAVTAMSFDAATPMASSIRCTSSGLTAQAPYMIMGNNNSSAYVAIGAEL